MEKFIVASRCWRAAGVGVTTPEHLSAGRRRTDTGLPRISAAWSQPGDETPPPEGYVRRRHYHLTGATSGTPYSANTTRYCLDDPGRAANICLKYEEPLAKASAAGSAAFVSRVVEFSVASNTTLAHPSAPALQLPNSSRAPIGCVRFRPVTRWKRNSPSDAP